MKTSSRLRVRRWLVGFVILGTLAIIACGGAATATPSPTATKAPGATAVPATVAPTATRAAPTPTTQMGRTEVPIATATPVPTPKATAVPPTAAPTARDSMTVVTGGEPPKMDSHTRCGGIFDGLHCDNMSDPLTWQSGDDQRIVPTTATTGWEQLAPDKWRFQLRQGVKFHNGEAWNAQAALPLIAEYLGTSIHDVTSFGYTGPFTGEAAGDYTLDITCAAACPIFPNTSIFMNFTAPEFLATSTEDEWSRQAVSFGPYKQTAWDQGVSITMEVYEDYVPAGDHYEMQKGVIREVKWVFRGEPQVMVAMVQAGEADIAWDVGVDALDVLDEDQIASGGSAETFAVGLESMWNPETSKQKVRQAMNYAWDCQEVIETLYGGHSICRGNIIWPGVIGASEYNTAPYGYDPDKARQLLDEAGYDFDTVLDFVSRGTRIPKQLEVLEAIQSYMADVGINVNLRVVEPSLRRANRLCRAGRAVKDLLEERGREVDAAEATLQEMQDAMDAARERGGASCPTAPLMEDEPSNETLDFGRQANFYMNCTIDWSPFCDPSPGGIQEKIAPAQAASGAERQRLLEELADFFHDQALWLFGFDLPVFYAVNPKLDYEPRFDRRVRFNVMRFD